MAPIRVGIIGLSATGSWATSAHLPYLQNSAKYTITAVANSSLESSQRAIEAHSLSASAQAFASPAELAASPNVDLVVVSVRVDRHYDAIKPVLAAGKDVFVEWPLAADLAQARELLALAKQKQIKTLVGLQVQTSPFIQAIKRLVVDERALGRVVNSNIVAAGWLGGPTNTAEVAYLNSKESGGNLLTIFYAHLQDAALYVLGELQGVSATLSIQHPTVQLTKDDHSTVVGSVQRTAHDQITVSGLLESGAQSTFLLRGGSPFKGQPAYVWSIQGDKAELQLRADSIFALNQGLPLELLLHDHASGQVSTVPVDAGESGPAAGVGRLYDWFADGHAVPDWDWAVKRHALIEAIYESSDKGSRTTYL